MEAGILRQQKNPLVEQGQRLGIPLLGPQVVREAKPELGIVRLIGKQLFVACLRLVPLPGPAIEICLRQLLRRVLLPGEILAHLRQRLANGAQLPLIHGAIIASQIEGSGTANLGTAVSQQR